MGHIAQHAQGQRIIWQKFIMEQQNTFRASRCQRETLKKIRCTAFKKVITAPDVFRANYCGFVAAGGEAFGLGAAGFAGAATAAAPTMVACVITSNLGYLPSR